LATTTTEERKRANQSSSWLVLLVSACAVRVRERGLRPNRRLKADWECGGLWVLVAVIIIIIRPAAGGALRA
jgi:hypothetical protein